MKQKLPVLLATATALVVTLGGCSFSGGERRAVSVSQPAPQLSLQIEKALADSQFPRALALAEELVASSPDMADSRVLLGRAYLANGRYASARSAFADAMTLGNREVRTIISLALADIAIGNGADAHALLAAHVDVLPVGDYGLAMALSGDAEEGVRALLLASQLPGATAQTRQNLAFALAIGGAWGQARLIAGQDLRAKDAEKRIGQWSQALMQHDPGLRVATMTGVLPRGDDAGMPVHLALQSGTAPEQLASAVAPSAPAPEVETAALVPFARELQAPQLIVPTAMPVQTAPAAPVIESVQLVDVAPMADVQRVAAAVDVVQPVALQEVAAAPLMHVREPAAIQPALIEAAPLSDTASVRTAAHSVRTQSLQPARDALTSDWVVQVGAFNSAAVARERSQAMARAGMMLAGFPQVQGKVTIKGRVFHRVAVHGFESRRAASQMCEALLTTGQNCFVRLDDSGMAKLARRRGAAEALTANAEAAPSGRQFAAR